MEGIGFIGTGTMGAPMCLNLCRAGFALTVHDRRREAAAPVLAAGAIWADTVREVAQNAGVVITMLPDGPDVEQVVLGPGGALDGAHNGLAIVDMSTIDPATSRRIAEACGVHGVAFVDAPVSGGVQGAREGTLTIMAGGAAETIDYLRPIFAALGAPDRLLHVGPVGSGEVVKLVNQHLVGVIAAATLEAFVLGARAGVAVETLDRVVSTSSGANWQLTHALREHALRGNFEPGFAMDLLLKDLRLVLGLGDYLHVPLTLAAAARQMYQAARALDDGRSDYSAVVRPLEQLLGLEVRLGEDARVNVPGADKGSRGS